MSFHEPVLVNEVLDTMNLSKRSATYCDCTVGGGGHLTAMLRATESTRFIGIDCDPEAIEYARRMLSPFSQRVILCEDNFANLGLILKRLNITGLNGVLFDLGVSYHQLATPGRGFSFEHDGELLMRMSPHCTTLHEKLKQAAYNDIVRVLKEYGDVRNSRRIGSAIYEQKKTLATTQELRNIIERCTPRRYLKKNLRKVFQALRIWVNDELQNLNTGLASAFSALRDCGRIVVISYHSGEDRIVKNTFRSLQRDGAMTILTKKIVRPTENEIKRNRRARSAKLRAGVKCGD